MKELFTSTFPPASNSRRALLAVAIGVGVALTPALALRVYLVVTGTEMLFNRTPSMPLGWYRKLPTPSSLRQGDIVCVQATDSQAPRFLREVAEQHASWRYETLLKRVAGLPGDRVIYDGRAVSINGKPLPLSILRASDDEGKLLPRPPFPLTLQPGDVWLASSHVDGLDSRYFGPVSTQVLRCAATPWLTF